MSTRRSAHQSSRRDCTCPACRARVTAEGRQRIGDYNDWAADKSADALAATGPTLQPVSIPRGLYRLRLTGNDLAPRYRDGDDLVIDPTPQSIAPGAAVLAQVNIAESAEPHDGIYFLNADGDLYANGKKGGTFHERGSFSIKGLVLGVWISVQDLKGGGDDK